MVFLLPSQLVLLGLCPPTQRGNYFPSDLGRETHWWQGIGWFVRSSCVSDAISRNLICPLWMDDVEFPCAIQRNKKQTTSQKIHTNGYHIAPAWCPKKELKKSHMGLLEGDLSLTDDGRPPHVPRAQQLWISFAVFQVVQPFGELRSKSWRIRIWDQIIQQNGMKERRSSMIKILFLLVLHHTKKIQYVKHSFDSFQCFFVCFFCFPTLRKSLFLALSTNMNLEKLRWTWGKGVPSDTHPIIPSRQPQNTTRFPETSLPSLLLRI